MELKWLEDFLCLIRLSSFSTAAAERHVTQSAFSRRIKALEQWLGVQLIDRSTYPITLTVAGSRFWATAEQVRATLYDARDNFQGLQKYEENTITFTAPHCLASGFFPSWLKAFEQSFGRLNIHMFAESMAPCIEIMTSGRGDFLIGYGHPDVITDLDPMSFDYLKLGVDRMIPVSAPLTDGSPAFALSSDDDAAIPYLAYESTSYFGQLMKIVLNRRRGSLHLIQCYEDAYTEAIKAMVLDKRGLAWLPETVIRETIGAGKLVRAGPKDWDILLDIRLYCPSQTQRPAATAFWTFLQGARIEGSRKKSVQ